MQGFELSIMINRPIEEAFAVLANLANDVKWHSEFVETKNTSRSSLGVGATFLLVGKLLGRRTGTVYEITEYEPNQIAAWKAVMSPDRSLHSGLWSNLPYPLIVKGQYRDL